MRLHFQEQHGFWTFDIAKPPYPMLPVRLIGPKGKSVDTFALLDSGADVSIFHGNWARKIGLKLTSGRKEAIKGIGSGQAILFYFHRIGLIVGSNMVRCDVAFSDNLGDELNDQLIGREVVFSKMRFALRQAVSMAYIGKSP